MLHFGAQQHVDLRVELEQPSYIKLETTASALGPLPKQFVDKKNSLHNNDSTSDSSSSSSANFSTTYKLLSRTPNTINKSHARSRENREERRRRAIDETVAARAIASQLCLSIAQDDCPSIFHALEKLTTTSHENGSRDISLPPAGTVAAAINSSTPVTVCGAEYVPAGGVFGDLMPDLFTPFARSDLASVVFRLPAAATRRLHQLARERDEETTDTAETTTRLLRPPLNLCLLSRHGHIARQQVGTLSFVEEESKFEPPLEPADIDVTVRTFIQPGWSFAYKLPGALPTAVLSLKAHNCRDFADSNAFKIARKSSAAEDFFFSADYKVESSTFSQWRLFMLTRKRMIPKASEQPFTGASAAGVARPQVPAAAAAAGSAAVFDSTDWTQFKAASAANQSRENQLAAESLLRLTLCYFPTLSEFGGVPLGTVTFRSHKADSLELVALVVFTVVALPFLLGLTVSCYNYRQRKLRREVRRFRLMLRREEIEERLLRQLGGVGEDDDDDDDG